MSSFEEDLKDWVSQIGENETAYRLPGAYRVIMLIVLAVIASGSIWGIFADHNSMRTDFAYAGIAVCLLLLYASIPKELYLNFEDKTYRKVVGFGPISIKESGPFSDINSIYVRRKGKGKGLPSVYAALEFKKRKVKKTVIPLPVEWHLVSTEPPKEPSLKKYAGELAAKIKVPLKVWSR